DALVSLHSHLHTKRYLISFHDKNMTSQVKATKSRTLISLIGDKVSAAVTKYQQGWNALCKLKCMAFAPQFKELKSLDVLLKVKIAADEVVQSDVTAR
ncbi:hypothetical protein B0H17DRAFT_927711, partial [Mycena rosella]